MSSKVLVLPGDGIGPEIVEQAVKVLDGLVSAGALSLEMEYGLIGGAATDETGDPLPSRTLDLARASDAVLFGAIGGPRWESMDKPLRPEAGLLRLRAGMGVFANLRPAVLFPQLAAASSLKPELITGLDIMIVRELTGGIYFGEPRGIGNNERGEREGFNTLRYSDLEVTRICRVAFETARKRGGRVCSVDKANVLEASELWREVAERVAGDYPDVSLSHMYVDNAAMQLVRAPLQFDVLVTTNLFGDILSDLAAMLTGSIGMLPSAALDEGGKGLYEPVHGSAPDIAGQDLANPLATILSAAMMLRYSLGEAEVAGRIEAAVGRVLDAGLRTRDLESPGTRAVSTSEMGDAVLEEVLKD